MEPINARAAMPSNSIFTKGTLQRMLEDQGFQDVAVKDLTENVKPMMRLFFLVAFIPYIIISFLGLQSCFVNTQARVEGYRVLRKGLWRFVAVSARKGGQTAASCPKAHGNQRGEGSPERLW
jgi:sterol 24-C-methyltransferase